MRHVTNARGEPIAISRYGEIVISDDNGRERERHKVPYGATLTVTDGAKVKAGQALANWDPHHASHHHRVRGRDRASRTSRKA